MNTAVPPRPKILVVDDTPANLLVMRKLLVKTDAELIEANNGTEALTACLDHEFALILLDVNMPDMDGFEVAELLAGEEKNQLTPIIFVTAAYADDVNKLKGYHSGAVDYIAKPIHDHILRSKVRVFLDLWSARQELKLLTVTLQQSNHALQQEVAERQRAEQQVRHQAYHDGLTGLPNRVLFSDRLNTAIERAMRHHDHFALLYIDIDGFKPVNDQYGHAMGDQLLREIARRLNAAVRKADTVARLGGDEFAIILEEITGPAEAMQMGQLLCQQLSDAFSLTTSPEMQPTTVQVGGSIGVAVYPHDGTHRDALLHAADEAMYRAKRSGKNQCLAATALAL